MTKAKKIFIVVALWAVFGVLMYTQFAWWYYIDCKEKGKPLCICLSHLSDTRR